MLSLILALTLAMSPNDEYKFALTDLANQAAPKSTRYVSMCVVPRDQRDSFLESFTFTLNLTSTEKNSRYYRPTVVGDLIRIDLTAIGWDKDFRAKTLERLEKSGIAFKFASPAIRAAFIDVWESFGAEDPYYKTRWIDPTTEVTARTLSGSSKFILRADWVLPRMLVKAKDGSYYSQLLLLAPSDADLYKRFNTAEQSKQLRQCATSLIYQQNTTTQASPPESDLPTQIGLLTAELGQLRQVLIGAVTSPVPLPPPAPPVVPPSDLAKSATAILQKKCAACHTAPAKSGDGFKILDATGALTSIAPLDKLSIDQRVYSGEMPPDPKQALTGSEYSVLRAWINEDKDAIDVALKGAPH